MKVTFKSKFTEAGNVVTFMFTPEKEVAWQAGQYMHYHLEIEGGRKDDHYFTIASAPYEKDLQISTRLTGSPFKNALNELTPGDQIIAHGPIGDFIWEDASRPKLMIAGGIGVTPFHSIFKQRSHDGQSMAATLLYATRDKEIPFKAEFDRWSAEHPEFSVAYLVGEPLTANLIKKHAPKLEECLVYLSGPEPMVEKIGTDLMKNQGVPKKQLRQDWFPGYTSKNY
jgi:ferredoxin-NADP reductase